MNRAILIGEVTVNDITENKEEVQILIFKDIQSGGMFGIDSSFIEQTFDEDEPFIVTEPINGEKVLLSI